MLEGRGSLPIARASAAAANEGDAGGRDGLRQRLEIMGLVLAALFRAIGHTHEDVGARPVAAEEQRRLVFLGGDDGRRLFESVIGGIAA